MKPAPDKLITELHATFRDITPEERLAHPSLHYCCDWDYLPIDQFSPEFESCLCFPQRERNMMNEVVRLRKALKHIAGGHAWRDSREIAKTTLEEE
jgi:hypothetical protein